MFYSSEGYTLRVMIDSDDNSETGYSMPGLGVDYVAETYGKEQIILSSMLYSFNDNRETNDWNGFNAISSVDARTLGNNVEMQIPFFDLGINSGSEVKVAWQTTDNRNSFDLADNVVTLNGNNFAISEKIAEMSSHNLGSDRSEIVIDGYFGDWINVEKQFNIISTAESEHIDLQNYAAIEQNDDAFMYLSVSGKMLNGIAIPSYSAKSIPGAQTSNNGNAAEAGVSNQASSPLPVLSNEDSIYVMIDTDNDYSTGYSSVGMGIGAEMMVEIKGQYGIITKRVLKEWTGSSNNDWEWTSGELISAAASGSELELEVVKGDYWIHIVGWDGDEDSSKSFATINDGGRYVAQTDTYFYYRFNGNLVDSSGNSRTLTTGGDPTTSSSGKMGNGLTLDGNDYVTNADEPSFHTNDWSFEAWINPSDTGDSSTSMPILFIGDGDGLGTADENQDELQIGMRDGHIELCYDSCSDANNNKKWFNSEAEFNAGTWYHIAVSHDADGNTLKNGISVFINNVRISNNGDPDLINFNIAVDTSYPASSQVEYYIGSGDLSGSGTNAVSNFNGIIDEVRWNTYEKEAFAGGLMISNVDPDTNTVTIYNSNSATISLDGIQIYDDVSDDNGCSLAGTLDGGATTTCSSGLSLGATDMIYMVDSDSGNDESGVEPGFNEDNKMFVIDGVCWNNDGSSSDNDCNGSGDLLITAGIWTAGTAVYDSNDDGIRLTSNGNNDEAVSDWEAIPEFGTILMPIASVLLIVGYSRLKRNNLEN